MLIDGAYPSKINLMNELGIEPDSIESASMNLIFNDLAKITTGKNKNDKMKNVYNLTKIKMEVRTNLLANYMPDFFPDDYLIKKEALKLSVLFNHFLTENTKPEDIFSHSMPRGITELDLRKAYEIQDQARVIKEKSDIDYPKNLRADNYIYEQESYFLAHINLWEAIQTSINRPVKYCDVLNHLRYDLSTAKKYIFTPTRFGNHLAHDVDIVTSGCIDYLLENPWMENLQAINEMHKTAEPPQSKIIAFPERRL